jgi:hypothetical protein
VSQPYRNRLNGLAQVAITQPVRDAAGQVRYVISGAINLKDRNILGALGDVKFGKSGYLFIVTSDGVMVDHPNTARILTNIKDRNGGNPEILRAMAGFEGTGEGVDETGVPSLYAFDRTERTNWVVGAMYPRAEAFAGIESIERSAWLGAVVLSLSAGALAFTVVRRRLKPLAELHRHMQSAREAPRGDGARHPCPPCTRRMKSATSRAPSTRSWPSASHRAQPGAQRGAAAHHCRQHSGDGLARGRLAALHLRQRAHQRAAQPRAAGRAR